MRRLHYGQRRVISRRRQRMNAVRALFAEADLLPNAAPDALKVPGLDPWRLRAEGLDRTLAGDELAVVLGHIARHRGFRSNAKRDAQANAAADASKMKKAIARTREREIGRETTARCPRLRRVRARDAATFGASSYGSSTVEPVVFRASRSRCACAASFKG